METTIEMTTKMWIELFVGSALIGCFAAIVVDVAVRLVGLAYRWLATLELNFLKRKRDKFQ